MEDYKNAIQEMIKGNKIMMNQLMSNLPYDKTLKGYISAINSNGTYSVMINGKQYDGLTTLNDIKPTIGRTVWVRIPEGQYSLMFIEGFTS